MLYESHQIKNIKKNKDGYTLIMKSGDNGYTLCEADWKEVPRWNKDKTQKDPEQFKKEQIAKNGEVAWSQNFENNFLGSSHTLIKADILKNITVMEDSEIIHDHLFNGLRIFVEPVKGRHYIVCVDPKQDGIDAIGLQVLDVTSLPFVQVATANLNETYSVIPSRVFDLGTYYYNAMVLWENNIEASLIDALSYDYEYEGEIYTEKAINGKDKNIQGVRTTTKTKKTNLSFLRSLFENDNIVIHDKELVNELFTFIDNGKGSYHADSGCKDDLVMALSLIGFPFSDFRNFNDFKGFSTLLNAREKENNEQQQSIIDYLDLGFDSSEITEEHSVDMFGNRTSEINNSDIYW